MTNPLLTLRSMVKRATPGEWYVDDHARDIATRAEPEDQGDIICDEPQGAPSSASHWDANAALIVTAVRALRVLTEEGMVEELAKALATRAGFEDRVRFHRTNARACLEWIATRALADQATGEK